MERLLARSQTYFLNSISNCSNGSPLWGPRNSGEGMGKQFMQSKMSHSVSLHVITHNLVLVVVNLRTIQFSQKSITVSTL